MSVWSGLSVVEPVEHNSDASSGQHWDSLQSVGPNQLWVNERYVYKILNSQFSQLSTKRSRLNHSSCKYSALSCALVFYSVFSCPSSHICKTGRLLALRYTDRAWNFLGPNRRRLSRKKYSRTLLPFSLRGEGTAVMEVGGGGGERRLYATATQPN